MWTIAFKEASSFFSSLAGLIISGVFLLVMGLMLFFFPDTSILSGNYANMDGLFYLAPTIFTFVIPAITMRFFAEELQTGTIELLATKPISDLKIIMGKFLAGLFLIFLCLVPTLVYYYTVYQLGSPVGNLDTGGIMGSYIGLFFLSASFLSIGIFASALTHNQVVAFVIGTFLCFICHWFFLYVSKIPAFVGNVDYILQKFGIDYHYFRMSKGVIDLKDVVFFLSVISIFLSLTHFVLQRRKW
ncbi:MAG TPA: ABC transporter permease subunit [Saprospiraceae bacterium]|nr:ABC transporter permease subunit [Saprospiraceae bacterium]